MTRSRSSARTRFTQSSVSGAREVNVVGMAQDQLGYYYPPEDYPQSELNPSDFILFNVSPALADVNVDAAALDATQLGFQGTPAHPLIDVVDPQAFDTRTQYSPPCAGLNDDAVAPEIGNAVLPLCPWYH